MPYIKQKYRTCKECGCIGGMFYYRQRIDRPTKLNIHSVCKRCKNEMIKDSYYKCSEDKIKNRYNIKLENMYLTENI